MKTFNPTLFISIGDEKELSALLKKRALEYIGIPNKIKYTEKGKPFIQNSFPVGISITHDEGVVALLITPFEPIGIDMEKIKEDYPKRVADRFFTEKERSFINLPKDFYKIWCQKESYVKMTGDGVGGISDFDIFSNRVIFTDLSEKISEITHEKFMFFICSNYLTNPDIIII